MEIDNTIHSISINERAFPVFFCKEHPKYELNLVCREKKCMHMGLICAKCLEAFHINKLHTKNSFLGIDDVINLCLKVASPVILSQNTHPAHFKDANYDSQFYRLDILCKSIIEKLKDFQLKINSLVKKLELNLKENIIQIRKKAVNNLGDVGELLNLIHQKVGYSEIQDKTTRLRESQKELLKDITQNQLNFCNQNINQKLNQVIDKEGQNNFSKRNLQEENKQRQFTDIINRITSKLSLDAKIIQIQEINEYINNYEQDLLEYEHDLKSEIDTIIDQTSQFIKKYYNQKENAEIKEILQFQQIQQLKENKIYTNIALNKQNLLFKSFYSGQVPCWIQLVDILKDVSLTQNIIVLISRGDIITKYLKTDVQTFLQNDSFLDSFTNQNLLEYQNDELQSMQLPQLFLYTI
ncbi:hypothetical protein TTHERM_00825220 (macronuclear) [Tetrahymena thermophila SB210]|uniref:Uncharacterized protein n=1 Tax=Tetrahymena thermophila (strain SB210) TaxID=312017 RepID=I7MF91_TETTS|nr:hypothetical protein TTHERM_00825220 [Tetrahymena thermophila SB210]EAR83727.2 hypothetical protein TTHERM_00825220 [Tetrahymena thermophila SB210]|eukprot:XP_001031390.2 hypothetical protein TTHERM_00825220 [Tetrahymena thermophila SB210]